MNTFQVGDLVQFVKCLPGYGSDVAPPKGSIALILDIKPDRGDMTIYGFLQNESRYVWFSPLEIEKV